MKKREVQKKLFLNKTTIAGLSTQNMSVAHGGQLAPVPRPSYDTPCVRTALCTNEFAFTCFTCNGTCLDCTMMCPTQLGCPTGDSPKYCQADHALGEA